MTAQQFVEQNTGGATWFGPYRGEIRNGLYQASPRVMLKDFAAWCFEEGFQAGLAEASQRKADRHEARDARREEA